MLIAQHSINFIQHWEESCKQSDFALRFPMFCDFLSYLNTHLETTLFDKMNRDPKLLKMVNKLFYMQLQTYIGEMYLRDADQL